MNAALIIIGIISVLIIGAFFSVFIKDEFEHTDGKPPITTQPAPRIKATAKTPQNLTKPLNFYGQYKSTTKLLTNTELVFFHALQTAAPNHLIMTQVSLRALVKTSPRNFIAINRIGQKHLDFVICDQSSRIICCVELNDHTHQRFDRANRDKIIDAILQSAGIPLLTFEPAAKYNFTDLSQLLAI